MDTSGSRFWVSCNDHTNKEILVNKNEIELDKMNLK